MLSLVYPFHMFQVMRRQKTVHPSCCSTLDRAQPCRKFFQKLSRGKIAEEAEELVHHLYKEYCCIFNARRRSSSWVNLFITALDSTCPPTPCPPAGPSDSSHSFLRSCGTVCHSLGDYKPQHRVVACQWNPILSPLPSTHSNTGYSPPCPPGSFHVVWTPQSEILIRLLSSSCWRHS